LNSAKKITKNPSLKKGKKKSAVNISIICYIVTGVLTIALIVGVLFDRLYQPVLLTLNGDKYRMNDLAYYFYTTEVNFSSYGSMFGDNFWDMVGDPSSNETMRESAIEAAKDTALSNEIIYREAITNNYTLTDEEKKKIETDVTALMKEEGAKKLIEKYDLTKSTLIDVYGKDTLSDRYRHDIIDAFDIDDDAIKATVKYDDYRQYDIEYLFISTQTTDEDGKTQPISSEDKSAAFDKINGLSEKTESTKEWSTLISKDEKELQYKKDSFIKTDDTFDKAFKKMMMTMKTNDVSHVYEAENGYYIVRMLNNNSSKSYDKAVDEAISTEENKRFSENYDKEILPKYKYKWNDKATGKIPMGSSTHN
jgi:foldase protein PrsA